MPKRRTRCRRPAPQAPQPTTPAAPSPPRRRLPRPTRALPAALLMVLLAVAAGCASGGAGNTSSESSGDAATGRLDCGPVVKLERILEPGTVALFGEVHGTRQVPAFFADVVCGALEAGHPVAVGLEMPATLDEPLRTYLHSAGDPEDREALVASSHFWTREYQDGRASRAILELVEELRRWAAAGLPVDVFAFDAARSLPSPQAREEEMARRLTAAVRGAGEDSLVFALTGNLHARMAEGAPWNPSFRPMGLLAESTLPDRHWITLDARSQGGTAWTCTGASAESCGSRRVGGVGPGPRGVDVGPRGKGVAYNGTFHVGPVTSSPPAAAGDDAAVEDSR